MGIYFPNIIVNKPLIKLLLRNKRDKQNFDIIPSSLYADKRAANFHNTTKSSV